MQSNPNTRQHFAYLLPKDKQWFTPKEVAEIIGRSPQYVRNAFEDQQLMGHTLSVQTQAGTAMRKRHQITREALLLFLLETANYEPKNFVTRLEGILKRLERKDLNTVKGWINNLLE